MTVYADGEVLIEPNYIDEPNYSWQRSSTAVVPESTRVLGIACKDEGAVFGIVASLDNGIVTDDRWFCSSTDVLGWNLPNFEDSNSDFSKAKNGNGYGDG